MRIFSCRESLIKTSDSTVKDNQFMGCSCNVSLKTISLFHPIYQKIVRNLTCHVVLSHCPKVKSTCDSLLN